MRNMTFCSATLCCFFLWVANGVCGDSDEVKSVSVMEGHSVTLHTNLTHIQTHDQILWMFGPQENRIAQIIKQFNLSSIYDDTDVRFRDRLKLDSQTGSLTITNINITDSGLYKLQIFSDKGTSYKRFSVTVYAHLPVPVITRISNSSNCSSSSSERSSISSCVLLCSVLNVPHVTLSWYNGNSLLSNISVSDLNIRLSLRLEVKYQDTNTYSCVLNNPITKQTQRLNINQLCGSCPDPPGVNKYRAGIISVVVLVILALVVIYIFYKKHKRDELKGTAVETTEEEVHYAEATFHRQNQQNQKKSPCESETIYSTVTT